MELCVGLLSIPDVRSITGVGSLDWEKVISVDELDDVPIIVAPVLVVVMYCADGCSRTGEGIVDELRSSCPDKLP